MDDVQRLNLYAPECYFQGDTLNGYTAKSAPIFMPNLVGGYMPGRPGKPELHENGHSNTILAALRHGYVVACPGIRGRTSQVGKAPALIADLKAVVRYLRHHRDLIPGNTERIITSGTSAGGALSALAGASGNQPAYQPYLAAIGAADERDDIFAANCYCPIVNLENADPAYEWQFCDETYYRSWSGEGHLDQQQQLLACQLKPLFPAYLNSLGLTDENGQPQMAEYTAWREDCYESGHRPDRVTFTRDIAVDARRRDFSANALYQQVHEAGLGPVIDPTGGLKHLAEGKLHTATENPDLVLRNDGHRILRGARFQAELDLTFDEEHIRCMRRHAQLVGDIAPERARDEVEKILLADFRYPMLKRRFPATESGLRTLHVAGVWEALFPSVVYDEAAVCAFKRLRSSDLSVRLALLCRNAPAEHAEAMMKHLHFPAKVVAKALVCLQAMQPEISLLACAKLGMEALESARDILCALEDETALARMDQTLKRLQGKPLSLKALAVNGADLKPLFEKQGRPLREMSSVLDVLWEAVLNGETENTKEALLDAQQHL